MITDAWLRKIQEEAAKGRPMGHAEMLRQMAKDYPPDCQQYAAACAAGAEAIREVAKLRRQMEELLTGDADCQGGCGL